MRLCQSMSLSLLLLLTPAISAQVQNNQTILQPGSTIERTISSTESHSYTIDLTGEQYLQFTVDQHGIDLIVRVFSPAGKSLGEFDSPNGTQGPENVAIVAVVTGSYRIVVGPLNQNKDDESGSYEIKVLELRPATDQELKVGKTEEDRKAKGLALLNEIVDSIPEIRQPRTRIHVKLQSAPLLWTIDEKKAAKMLSEAITDSRDYLLTLKPDGDSYDEAEQWDAQIRFEALQTLAIHDAEAALSLLRSTRRPVSPETDRGDLMAERQFELGLASRIAAKNPKRAFELAEDSLKEGFSATLIQTLESLRRADRDLAATLARDIAAKLLQEKFFRNPEAGELAMSLIRTFGARSNGPGSDLQQLFSRQDYRALVQKAVTEAISARANNEKVDSRFAYMMLMNLKQFLGSELDSIMPGSIAAIDKKLKELGPGDPKLDLDRHWEFKSDNFSSETGGEEIGQAPLQVKLRVMQAEKNFGMGDYARARQLITETIKNPRQRRQMLNELEQRAAFNEISLGHMEEALKHISRLATMEDRAKVLGEIAGRIGPGNKRANALALLETARSLLGISIQAENQPQMQALMQLAGAFSRYDSKRGFEILEPLVDQFNDLSIAARTLNGFGSQYFVEGELSMQNGNNLANIANLLATTLGILSLTDFDKAKTTCDRLHLPEVRVIARLSIAQQAIRPNGVYSPSVANSQLNANFCCDYSVQSYRGIVPPGVVRIP